MTKNKNRQWILNVRPAGRLTGEEFRWNEVSIPQPSDGQVLVRNLWLSVDPAQRTWMTRDPYNRRFRLVRSCSPSPSGRYLNPVIPTSSRVTSFEESFSWQDYVVTDGQAFGGMQGSAWSVARPRVESVRG